MVHHRPARRMYVCVDGLLVHLHGTGWTECTLGIVYTTTTRILRTQPDQVEIRGIGHKFMADLTSVTTFVRRLWSEAAQRGVLAADEVVVLGDGANWIWNLASSYVLGVTHAIYGEGSAAAET